MYYEVAEGDVPAVQGMAKTHEGLRLEYVGVVGCNGPHSSPFLDKGGRQKSRKQITCVSPSNHLPLLPPGPGGVGWRRAAQNLFPAKIKKRREGDSNPRRLLTLHDFQSCTFDHSDISPIALQTISEKPSILQVVPCLP